MGTLKYINYPVDVDVDVDDNEILPRQCIEIKTKNGWAGKSRGPRVAY